MVEQQQSGTGNQQKDEQQKKPIPLNLTEGDSTTSGAGGSLLSASALDPIVGSAGNDYMIGGGPLTPLLGTFQNPESNTEIMDEEMDELRNVAVAMPDKKYDFFHSHFSFQISYLLSLQNQRYDILPRFPSFHLFLATGL